MCLILKEVYHVMLVVFNDSSCYPISKGIGIDDMFVMLSSWRHTDYRLPAEERMGLMMKTAAVSVTLTSVTDAMAFLIGAITTFRSV